MIPFSELGGWVKLHRGLLLSPVWQNGIAYRVYSSLYLRTSHKERIQTVNSMAVKLLAGQLLTSQAEICELTGYSRKAVRSALEYLARQKAVTVCGQYGNTGTVYAVHPFPFMEGEGGEGGCFSGPKFGPETRPNEYEEPGHDENDENSLCDRGVSLAGDLAGAGTFFESWPDVGPEGGPAINNKDEEVEKLRNNPLPPFKKGAGDFSSSVSFILNMWRETCEAAGVPYIEDKKTVRGAEAIARELLGTGKADADAIRKGMKNLLVMKASEPKAKLYNLGTLCRGLSNFVAENPAGHGGNQGAAIETVYEWFTLHCPVCCMKHIRKLPVNRPDKPIPETMPCFTKDCTGAMTVCEGAF